MILLLTQQRLLRLNKNILKLSGMNGMAGQLMTGQNKNGMTQIGMNLNGKKVQDSG